MARCMGNPPHRRTALKILIFKDDPPSEYVEVGILILQKSDKIWLDAKKKVRNKCWN